MLAMLFILIINATSLWAVEVGDFYLAAGKALEQVPIQNMAQIKKAVKNFTPKHGTQNNDCSLTFISSNGYALTARHCIESLIPDGAISEKSISTTLSYKEIDLKQVLNKDFPLTLIENASYAQGDVADLLAQVEANTIKTKARIISILPGQLIKAPISIEERFEVSLKHNLDNFSDIALLKFDVEDVACVQDANPVPNELVAMVGFPGARPRSIFHDIAETNPPAMSFGEICTVSDQSFEKVDELLTAMEKILSYFGIQENKKAFKRLTAKYSDELIFHSALLSPGASGSGLFNQDGKIVGVNVSMIQIYSKPNPHNPLGLWKPQQTYTPGTYIAVPMQRIKKIIQSQGIDLTQVFNCQ